MIPVFGGFGGGFTRHPTAIQVIHAGIPPSRAQWHVERTKRHAQGSRLHPIHHARSTPQRPIKASTKRPPPARRTDGCSRDWAVGRLPSSCGVPAERSPGLGSFGRRSVYFFHFASLVLANTVCDSRRACPFPSRHSSRAHDWSLRSSSVIERQGTLLTGKTG